MTGAPSKPLPAPPADPYEGYRILTDGDTCDHPRCPATAYVRVHVYRDGDKEWLAGTLHWCCHHWHQVQDAFLLMQTGGRCGIIDETEWVEA